MKKFMIVLCLGLIALLSACKGQGVEASGTSSVAGQSTSAMSSAQSPTTSSTVPSVQSESSVASKMPTASQTMAARPPEMTSDGALLLHREQGDTPTWLDSEADKYRSPDGRYSIADCKSSFGPYYVEGPAWSRTVSGNAWPGASYRTSKTGISVHFDDQIPQGLITENVDSDGVIFTIVFNLNPEYKDYFISTDELGEVDLDTPQWQSMMGSVCGHR